MKSTGIIRRVDEHGRVAIPKVVREVLKIEENTLWNFNTLATEKSFFASIVGLLRNVAMIGMKNTAPSWRSVIS